MHINLTVKHLKLKYILIVILVFFVIIIGIHFLLISRPVVSPDNNDIGISVNGLTTTSEDQINNEFKSISNIGFRWIRTDFIWSEIQPDKNSDFRWEKYDQIVNTAHKYNLNVLGILDYAPKWDSSPSCTTSCAPVNDSYFASFASTTAKHFNTRVTTWEIWNEENSVYSWSPKPNALSYSVLLKLSYNAIKKVEPNDFVLMGGLAVVSGPYDPLDTLTFLDQLYEDGSRNYFDALAYHPYTFPETPLDRNNGWSQITTIHKLMTRYGDGNKAIWVTEYGAPTNGPKGMYVSQAMQAADVKDAYYSLTRFSWLKHFFWYTFQDKSTGKYTNQKYFGIISSNNKPKLAYYVWKKLLSNN
jgi:hypothetical protein